MQIFPKSPFHVNERTNERMERPDMEAPKEGAFTLSPPPIHCRHHPEEEGGKSSNSSRHDGWGRGRRAAEAQARRSYRAGFIPLKKNDLILCDMAKVGGSGERFGADLGKGSTPIWHGHCQNPPNISPNS